MVMATIAYTTHDAATTRSRELWTAVLGREKHAADVTEYLYHVAVRNDEPEAVQELPDGVDVAIVVHERDDVLDGLLRADEMTADEVAALVGLYPAWSGDGVAYVAGDIRAHGGTLYRIVQPHTSQVDWTPDATPALWVRCAPAGVIPAWVQPTGAQDAYALDALVTYQGQVWRSTIAANVWPPGTGALWVVVE